MNTASFESGAKKVQNIDREIRKKEKINRFENANEAKKVTAMLNEFEATRIAYKRAAAKITESSSKQEIKNLEKLRKEYYKLGDAYDNAVIKLKENIDRRKLSVSLMREEAEEYKKSQGFLSKNTSSLKKLGVAFGGVSAASGLAFAKFNSVMGELDSISKRARDIGITASQLQEFGHQARLAGIETSELDTSLKAFNRNVSLAAMGTGEARQALNSMGIELTDNNGRYKKQSELLKEVLTYFEENKGAAENAGRAARLFGETGSNIIRIFESGEDSVNKIFDASGIDQAARQAEIYKENIEEISNTLQKLEQRAGGTLARTFNYLFNKDRAIQYFTTIQDGSDALTKDFVAQEMGYKNVNEYLNVAITSEKEREKIREERKAQEEAAYNAKMQQIYELDAKLEEFRKSEMSADDRILNLEKKIFYTKRELSEMEKGSVEYIEKYKIYINDVISLEKLQNQEADKRKKLSDKEAAEEAKKAAAEKKRLESEQKKAAEEAAALKLKREEYDLNLKISMLQASGDKNKQAQAEALKNSMERNKLMKEYGFSIEEATTRLKAQQQIQNNGKVQYSEDDVAKAKKILERGEGGSVGKKTLEQAQAIVEGKDIEDKELSIFKGVKNRAKGNNELRFASNETLSAMSGKSKSNQNIENLNITKSSSQISTSSSSPKKESVSEKEKESYTYDILGAVKRIYTSLDNIQTSFNQFLKQYKGANA